MGLLNNKEVGSRLRFFRENNGLSKRQFAMKAGVDQSQYSKIENGELPITKKILDKLTTTYTMDGDYMLHGMNVPREHFEDQVVNEDPVPIKKYPPTEQKSDYLRLLEDNDRFFKDLLKSNLVGLQTMLHSLLANVEAGFQYALDREAGNDAARAEMLKAELDKRIGEKMGAPIHTGRAAGK